jgi:hypothetical protein
MTFLLNTIIFCQTLSLYYLASKQAIRVRYTTIETKEADHIGYNGLLFPHEYSCGKGIRLYTIQGTAFVSIVVYITCTILAEYDGV